MKWARIFIDFFKEVKRNGFKLFNGEILSLSKDWNISRETADDLFGTQGWELLIKKVSHGSHSLPPLA